MPEAPKPYHIHGESTRVGIALASKLYTGAAPPRDKVDQILRSLPANYYVSEFPLDAITQAHRERQDRRRLSAKNYAEIMLHHAGDSQFLTQDALERISAKAWQMATLMEEQEHISATLDSAKPEI